MDGQPPIKSEVASNPEIGSDIIVPVSVPTKE